MLQEQPNSTQTSSFEEFFNQYKWWILGVGGTVMTILYLAFGAQALIWAASLAGIGYGIAEFSKSPVKGIIVIVAAVLIALYITPLVAGGVGFLGRAKGNYDDAAKCIEIITRSDADILKDRTYEYKYKHGWFYRLFHARPSLESVQAEREDACEPCKYIKENDKKSWYLAKGVDVVSNLQVAEYWCDERQSNDEESDNEGETSNGSRKKGTVKGPSGGSNDEEESDPAPTPKKTQKKRVERPQTDPPPTKEEKKPATGKSRYGGK